MSKPRRAFGSTRPGQLVATRLKVVAAELADPQRLNRGRRYARDGSVVDITVDELATAAVVVGSRSEPYLVELTVERGDGPPSRDELAPMCTCPDADPAHHPIASSPDAESDPDFDGAAPTAIGSARPGSSPSSTAWRPRLAGSTDDITAGVWCKHAIAALLVLADEIAIEPELLDRWRGADPDVPVDPERATSVAALHVRRSGHPVHAARYEEDDHTETDAIESTAPDVPDLLAEQLAVPAGASMPLIPAVEPLDRPLTIGDEVLSRWVTEMHGLLRHSTDTNE